MVQKLEQVQCNDQSVLEGAGDLIYVHRESVLRGNVKNIKQYYQADKERYRSMLASMNKRWYLYISCLETEIIEAKLECILESLTFKYSRQPELLSLIPDKMHEINLRLASTIKILNDSKPKGNKSAGASGAATNMNNDKKFYKDVYGDPDRTSDLSNIVGSVLHVGTAE